MKMKKIKKTHKLDRIAHRLISTLKLKIFLLILIFGLLFLFFCYLELRKEYVLIEPFDVPKDFEKYGYTGRVIANKLSDQINLIRTSATTRIERISFVPIWSMTYIDIEIKEYGISLNSFIQYIRRFFGREITRVVGEITCIDSEINYNAPLFITIRISNKPAKAIPGNLKDIDDILLQASEHIYKYTQPYVLASYLYNIDDPIACRETIQYLLSHEPPDDDSWGYNLWGLLLSNIDYEGAINKYQKAIELDSKFIFSYYNWGNILLLKNNYEDAIDKYDKAIKLNRENAYPYCGWGRVLLFGQGEYENAMEKFEKAIKLDPQLGLAYSGRGCCYVYNKQYKKAIKDLEKAVDLNPNNFEDYLNICEVKIYTGDYDHVLFYSNEVLRLSRKIEDVILSLYFQCVAEKLLDLNTKKTEKTLYKLIKYYDLSDFYVYEFKPPYTIDGLCQTINDDKLYDKEPVNTIDKVNELLKDANFYFKVCQKKNCYFSTEVKKQLKIISNTAFKKSFLCLSKDDQIKIKRLNRFLLEEIYPRKTPKSQKITVNWDFKVIENWLDAQFSVDEFKNKLCSTNFCESEFELLSIEKLCNRISNDIKLNLKASYKTMDWLNELLTVPNFYNKLVGKSPDLEFSEDIKKMVNKTVVYRKKDFSKLNEDEQHNIKRLNRLVLEETYLQETPKNDQWKIKRLCEEINKDGYDLYLESKENTIDWLNELLEVKNFYDRLLNKVPKSKLSNDVKYLVKETENYRKKSKKFSDLKEEQRNKIKRLNRLLLEETYPKITPKSHVNYGKERFIREKTKMLKKYINIGVNASTSKPQSPKSSTENDAAKNN